jgi:hypothetical protein
VNDLLRELFRCREIEPMFYQIVMYFHVVGVLGWFFATGVEAVALSRLGRASTAPAQRDALGVLRLNRVLGPVTALLVLVPGIYLAQTVWSGHPAWIGVGYGSFLLVLLLGAAVSGRQWIRLERALAAASDAERAHDISLTTLLASFYVRVGVLMAASFVMVVKPQSVIAGVALGVGILGGLGIAFATTRARTRSSSVQRPNAPQNA